MLYMTVKGPGQYNTNSNIFLNSNIYIYLFVYIYIYVRMHSRIRALFYSSAKLYCPSLRLINNQAAMSG